MKKWDSPWLLNKIIPLFTGILSTGLAAAYYSGGKVCYPLLFQSPVSSPGACGLWGGLCLAL